MVEDSRREGKCAYCWFLSWAGPLHALLTVANVVSVANPNSQLSTGNIGIDNWQHSHTGNIQQDGLAGILLGRKGG